MDVTIVIPTFNREDGLRQAVQSLYRQTGLKQGFTLIIVDNSPQATAHAAIEALKQDCPDSIKLLSLHAPQPGVSNARNAAMEAVSTQLVAFLDDDQIASEHWLQALLETHQRYPAAVTFGPVETRLPETLRQHRTYFSHFFSRLPEHETGYIDHYYGCGNALIDLRAFGAITPRFNPIMNETGGEDDLLFRQLEGQKNSFAWAANALVSEAPVSARLSPDYTLRRAFSYGQAPVTLAFFQSPPDILSMLKWMIIGAGKLTYYSLKWLALYLTRHPRRMFALDQAIRGLGKLIWFVDFHAYGAAALNTKRPRLRWIRHPGRP